MNFEDMILNIATSIRSGRTVDASIKRASGLNEMISSEGGFLVPPDVSSSMIPEIIAHSFILPLVKKYTANSNELIMPGVDQNGNTVTAYWTGEGKEITSSKMAFREIKMVLKKLAAATSTTNELVKDSPIMGILKEKLMLALSLELEQAILTGDGSGKPLGFVDSPARYTVPKETAQLADTIVANNIIKMWSHMPPASTRNAVWLISSNVFPELSMMSLSTGTAGSLVYMPSTGLSGSMYGTLMGRPIYVSEFLPLLGEEGDIILWDPSSYVMLMDNSMTVETSTHYAFMTDETWVRAMIRVDGQCLYNAPITLPNGFEISPIVTLQTR